MFLIVSKCGIQKFLRTHMIKMLTLPLCIIKSFPQYYRNKMLRIHNAQSFIQIYTHSIFLLSSLKNNSYFFIIRQIDLFLNTLLGSAALNTAFNAASSAVVGKFPDTYPDKELQRLFLFAILRF